MLNKLASCAAALAALALLPAPAGAQLQIFADTTPWTVDPPFSPAPGNAGITGAACISANQPVQLCVAATDVSNLVQIFKISGDEIAAGPLILLDAGKGAVTIGSSEIDAEGVGHGPGFFYVVGSRPRVLPLPPPPPRPRFNRIFRFPINDRSGVLPFKPSETTVAPEIESATLTAALAFAAINAAPDEKGASDIKGIAVIDERLFIGLRRPALGGKDIIMSVHANAVFSPATQAMDARFHPLALGPNLEIRDLARVAGGILILAGPPDDAAGANSLFRWDVENNVLRRLADFVDPTDRRAESLTVLGDDPEFVQVLVMFDGTSSGGPLKYHIPL